MNGDDEAYCATPQSGRTDDLGFLSPEEVTLIKKHREKKALDTAYNRGVQDCIVAIQRITEYRDRSFVPRPVQTEELLAALRELWK